MSRPPIDPHDPSVPVYVSLPSKQLAAAKAQADHYRMTVQDWLRKMVKEQTELNRKK